MDAGLINELHERVTHNEGVAVYAKPIADEVDSV